MTLSTCFPGLYGLLMPRPARQAVLSSVAEKQREESWIPAGGNPGQLVGQKSFFTHTVSLTSQLAA